MAPGDAPASGRGPGPRCGAAQRSRSRPLPPRPAPLGPALRRGPRAPPAERAGAAPGLPPPAPTLRTRSPAGSGARPALQVSRGQRRQSGLRCAAPCRAVPRAGPEGPPCVSLPGQRVGTPPRPPPGDRCRVKGADLERGELPAAPRPLPCTRWSALRRGCRPAAPGWWFVPTGPTPGCGQKQARPRAVPGDLPRRPGGRHPAAP